MANIAIRCLKQLACHEWQPLIQDSNLLIKWWPDQPCNKDEHGSDYKTDSDDNKSLRPMSGDDLDTEPDMAPDHGDPGFHVTLPRANPIQAPAPTVQQGAGEPKLPTDMDKHWGVRAQPQVKPAEEAGAPPKPQEVRAGQETPALLPLHQRTHPIDDNPPQPRATKPKPLITLIRPLHRCPWSHSHVLGPTEAGPTITGWHCR